MVGLKHLAAKPGLVGSEGGRVQDLEQGGVSDAMPAVRLSHPPQPCECSVHPTGPASQSCPLCDVMGAV